MSIDLECAPSCLPVSSFLRVTLAVLVCALLCIIAAQGLVQAQEALSSMPLHEQENELHCLFGLPCKNCVCQQCLGKWPDDCSCECEECGQRLSQCKDVSKRDPLHLNQAADDYEGYRGPQCGSQWALICICPVTGVMANERYEW
jgi:hypothetical protein